MAGCVKLNERKRNITKSDKEILQEGDGKEKPSQVQKQGKQEKNEQPKNDEKWCWKKLQFEENRTESNISRRTARHSWRVTRHCPLRRGYT